MVVIFLPILTMFLSNSIFFPIGTRQAQITPLLTVAWQVQLSTDFLALWCITIVFRNLLSEHCNLLDCSQKNMLI